MPKCLNRSLAVPDAPKPFMPTTSPAGPTYRHQLWVAAASIGLGEAMPGLEIADLAAEDALLQNRGA